MNKYSYLRKNNELNNLDKKESNVFVTLSFFSWLLGILFSIFFIVFFVVLSHTLHDSIVYPEHLKIVPCYYNPNIHLKAQNTDNSFLCCMIVF